MGHCAHQAGEGISDAHVERRLTDDRGTHAKDLKGEIDQPRRTRFGIVFEVRKALWPLAVEILLAGIDKPLEMFPCHQVLADGRG